MPSTPSPPSPRLELVLALPTRVASRVAAFVVLIEAGLELPL
jgi:hypothetical protein